ncbi:MAG: hypothetical protein LC725_10195 [Lentisphaerae bacterium]|nr:hypothetical protein [Lentisphaerota bacterium]
MLQPAVLQSDFLGAGPAAEVVLDEFEIVFRRHGRCRIVRVEAQDYFIQHHRGRAQVGKSGVHDLVLQTQRHAAVQVLGGITLSGLAPIELIGTDLEFRATVHDQTAGQSGRGGRQAAAVPVKSKHDAPP